ncbi:MAG: PKD domain-containing protein, partial [Mucilaginibacter sp.]
YAYSTLTIITVIQPPTRSNAGLPATLCNITSYPLKGNQPTVGTGRWSTTAAGVTFSSVTDPNATASGLVPGNSYIFTWTISSGPCQQSTSTVTITSDRLSIGGTTAGAATVCAGDNNIHITLSGQYGNILRWESSVDAGASWQTVVNQTGTSLSFTNLTRTTRYRAVVKNGVCDFAYSTVTIVTVNQPVMQANAGNDQNLCGAVSAALTGNNPAPFAGIWTQTGGPAVTIASPNNYQTQLTGLVPGNDYTFVWTIKGQPPCADSRDEMIIHDRKDVTASFTASQTDGCGDYTVNFTNTSTSLSGITLAGTSFRWDFGDGSAPTTAVSPSHTFVQRTDGRDTVYTVSLSVVDNCFPRPPFTLKITVRPKNPIATILPVSLVGCSPFAISVKNTSPGNNTTYAFYLYDGTTLVQRISKTDKSTAVFNPVSATDASKVYTVYMVATGFCNNSTESRHIPITVSAPGVAAQMFIQGSINKGCAPLDVIFVNNSSGGDNYFYTIYDANNQVVAHITAGTANLPYTFTRVGTFYVTISGSDNCAQSESPRTRVDVYPIPQPNFDADVRTGCSKITVNFTNLTTSTATAPASSLTYVWDFGDFSQSFAFTPPPHTYTKSRSPYTVTLTATNPATGCTNVMMKKTFIVVNSPPGTEFTARPDTITSIPNYHFSFVDETTASPVKWRWTLGDGSTSTLPNPEHTYADTGYYKVTLTTTNAEGCDSTMVHHVRINGVPGQLFLPNAFMPTSATTELRTFMAKGSGMRQWHMQIFNNYGQLIWETTKLDEKGAPVDGWDGTFKGVPVQQGVYVWQVSATFINGTEWKGMSYNNSLPRRTGVIHLIR